MSINQAQEAAPYIVGTVAVTNPIWLNLLGPGYQVIVAVLGLAVLILTIRNKWLEIKIKQKTLDE